MKTAEYWKQAQKNAVRCQLCPHSCLIHEGQSGKCGARVMMDGELKAMTYGLVLAANVDPIEKKPLYHFMPGEGVFSIGTCGCNFACEFCQNWSLARQSPPAGERISPERVVESAKESGSKALAFTYNEPLVGFEFVRDCSALANRAGLATVLVTNGFVSEAPAVEILPLINALNIDIKSMDDAFYKKYCHGALAPVLRFAVQAMENGCHVEITNLVIPGLNDSNSLFEELSGWIAEELGPETPLHLSAYRPEYKMTIPATPADTLLNACEICRTNLKYVYAGNMPLPQYQNTVCPDCGTVQIERSGYDVKLPGIGSGKCAGCGRQSDIVFRPLPVQ